MLFGNSASWCELVQVSYQVRNRLDVTADTNSAYCWLCDENPAQSSEFTKQMLVVCLPDAAYVVLPISTQRTATTSTQVSLTTTQRSAMTYRRTADVDLRAVELDDLLERVLRDLIGVVHLGRVVEPREVHRVRRVADCNAYNSHTNTAYIHTNTDYSHTTTAYSAASVQ